MIYGILIVLQMIIAILLVVSILLQSSKGSGLAGIAGGMMSSTVFGGRSAASFLSKATTVLAALFMLNCLGMAVLSSSRSTPTSVTQQAVNAQAAESPVPSIPGGATATPSGSEGGSAPEQAPGSTPPAP